ncbi:GntR family transcriptional regulator [Alkalihalophilus pseudofirmus OF4]|uniref:GntR family transcriptional regulator n=1 Tax=Alkalihalophilus pseudofirmus (strain ATCC BAA-2126 / JCM 17055 / OF4) TaxID=398511 RepID=D3FXA0_ALKPO|nr:UTRA domain-containing protein [Alkalihalophilus pseudofirmus]ADC50611.1 GntR family transcriptional regulator [Alkalihalophilus pseudofirmus OF4]
MKTSSPLYRQIAKQMKEKIHKKAWLEGETIPTEAKLVEMFQASRVTIRQAINLLVNEGLLYKIQGSGTYVKENKIEHNIYSLKSFTEEMNALEKQAANKILTFQLIDPPDEIRSRLGIQEGEQVVYVRRLRMIEDKPLVIEDTYMPIKLFPDLSLEVMQGSKYHYIEQTKQFKIKESFQEVLPYMPPDEIRELLHLDCNIPIIKVQLSSTLKDDTVFEYSELYFKSDEYKFTIVATRT